MGQGFSLALFIGVPLCQSCITGLAGQKHIKNWYEKLKKPKWTPPNWLFPPLDWAMMTCGGIASWLIWRKGGFSDQSRPLTLYGIQLILNLLWSPLFFNGHKVKLALADAVALDVMTAATMCEFMDRRKSAGYLMTPYLAYVVFFTAWNLQLAIDNPDADKIEGEETTTTKAETPVTLPPAPTPPASGSTPTTTATTPVSGAVSGASSKLEGEAKKAK